MKLTEYTSLKLEAYDTPLTFLGADKSRKVGKLTKTPNGNYNYFNDHRFGFQIEQVDKNKFKVRMSRGENDAKKVKGNDVGIWRFELVSDFNDLADELDKMNEPPKNAKKIHK